MAEASAAAAVSQHRFFCHSCKGEVSPKLPVSAGGWGRGVCVCGWGGGRPTPLSVAASPPAPGGGGPGPGVRGSPPPPPKISHWGGDPFPGSSLGGLSPPQALQIGVTLPHPLPDPCVEGKPPKPCRQGQPPPPPPKSSSSPEPFGKGCSLQTLQTGETPPSSLCQITF